MSEGDSSRWSEIRAHFDELVDLEPTQRNQRLSRLAETDPELTRAVESLIGLDAVADEQLKRLEFGFDHLLAFSASVSTVGPDPLNLTGRTISHFRILEPLAAGGMGVVYRAQDTQLQRTVALKFPLPHHAVDAAVKERFLREARSAGALDHPNLCSVYEAGESDAGELFLAMPLYAGETLKTKLAANGSLPVKEALDIARQIAEGLAYAHAAGIVHRDLKPGNVMLLPDGEVKILDFGLAKVADASHSATGGMLGTVAYMSPEQIRSEAVNQRADLWAVGVLLYEMLTGKRPFVGEHEISIARTILADEPQRPSALCSEIPRPIEELIITLLQKEPARRYASAQELAADLAALRRGATPLFRRRFWPRPADLFRAGARRQLALASGVIVVTLTALAALTLSRAKATLPVMAVGAITAVDLDADDPSAGALPFMLSTHLAQTAGVQVVSHARMQELLARTDGELAAARAAHAGLLLEGELSRDLQGAYRLRLRHVDVGSGKLRRVHTLQARDATQLAYEAAASVSRLFGLARPSTTRRSHSVVALSLYEHGLRVHYGGGDRGHGFAFFSAALKDDSTFALAAMYAARAGYVISMDSAAKYYARAEALANSAADQDRLLISTSVALHFNEPRALAVAETLATRYPNDPAGAVQLGDARRLGGDFLGAVAQYQRAVALDATLQSASSGNCQACASIGGLIGAYWLADSVSAALRTAREWTAAQPNNPTAWKAFATHHAYAGRHREASIARQKLAALQPADALTALDQVERYLRTGEFETADQMLAVVAQSVDLAVARQAFWWQVVSFRYQGRFVEAARAAARHRESDEARGNRHSALIARAVVLQEAGRAAQAAALYDTMIGLLPDHGRASRNARERAWWLTHAGDAAAIAGDTARLQQLADSVQAVGALSGYGRDPRLHHHLRGLLYRARGDLAAAEAEFKAAIFSTTLGYTRTNVELARVLMKRGRAAEAVPLIQAALRGSLDGSPLYVTRTELHETLAGAWQQVGARDSALYHYRRVLHAWRRADPSLHSHRQQIQRRVAALGAQL